MLNVLNTTILHYEQHSRACRRGQRHDARRTGEFRSSPSDRSRSETSSRTVLTTHCSEQARGRKEGAEG